MTANRLAKEKSPYLLQHAANPVDWFPWGEEAFEKARREDKPIFLSIGYSTCHWCHVMEEESFENPEVARLMNEHFVSIKVDREERPDIDNLYMAMVQAMTGSGGWPLSIFMTPDRKPFFGGTYWPPEDRWGRPGFVSVLHSVADEWKMNRPALLQQSNDLVQSLQRRADGFGGAQLIAPPLNETTFRAAYEELRSRFDPVHGGFGQGIKFPRSHTLSFLLRFWRRTGEEKALEMTEQTLRGMVRGGLWDHVGGGFHRYSTDREWFLPHFEKMLYDQALLARTYLETYQATGREEYADTVRKIFQYGLRDLRDPKGAFYSAEDADSLDPETGKKREGAFYVWKKEEILDLLGDEKGEVFCWIFGVSGDGNVQNDPQGEFPKRNVLFLAHSLEEASGKFGKSNDEIQKTLSEAKEKLFEARSKRPRPHRDDKILTNWNGLMISSLAVGSRVLGEPGYRDAAREAADFVLEKLVRHDGRLLHRYRDGEAAIPGTIEDYAFFIHGLFDLYEATFEPRYLAEAKRLGAEMVRLFWDEENGGFFFTGNDQEVLLVRQKEIYDGAIPSGNSVAALDLLRVGRLTFEKEFERKEERFFNAFSKEVHENPEAYPQLLIALDFALGPSREIVLTGKESDPAFARFLKEIYASQFFPNKVVAFHPLKGPKRSAIEGLAPFMENQLPLKGKTTVYVCENYVCRFPVTEPGELKELLEWKKKQPPL